MALLSFEDELGRARDAVPFANGFEFEACTAIWCEECIHGDVCPLLMVTLHEKTPAAWEDRKPRALNRYHCHEYVQEEQCPDSTESSLAPTVSPAASPSLKDGPRTSTSLSPEDINLRSSIPR